MSQPRFRKDTTTMNKTIYKGFIGNLKWVPKWAQKYIAHLEEGYNVTEGTRVTWRLLVGRLGQGEHYLPNGAVIRFHLGQGKDIEFMLLDGGVRVHTYHGRPVVETRASNELNISVDSQPLEA